MNPILPNAHALYGDIGVPGHAGASPAGQQHGSTLQASHDSPFQTSGVFCQGVPTGCGAGAQQLFQTPVPQSAGTQVHGQQLMPGFVPSANQAHFHPPNHVSAYPVTWNGYAQGAYSQFHASPVHFPNMQQQPLPTPGFIPAEQHAYAHNACTSNFHSVPGIPSMATAPAQHFLPPQNPHQPAPSNDTHIEPESRESPAARAVVSLKQELEQGNMSEQEVQSALTELQQLVQASDMQLKLSAMQLATKNNGTTPDAVRALDISKLSIPLLDISTSDAASNSVFLLSGLLQSVGLLSAAYNHNQGSFTDTDYKNVRTIMMRFIGKNDEIITDLRTKFMETGGTGPEVFHRVLTNFLYPKIYETSDPDKGTGRLQLEHLRLDRRQD